MSRTDSKEDGQRGESDLNKFRESMYFFHNVRVQCLAPAAAVDVVECFQLVGTQYQTARNRGRERANGKR